MIYKQNNKKNKILYLKHYLLIIFLIDFIIVGEEIYNIKSQEIVYWKIK